MSLLLLTTLLKLALVPAYHSTDFEVHRHWLSLTHSLPLTDWYRPFPPTPDSSPWTLDYPPLFAYAERLLAFPARLFDPAMLGLSNLNHATPPTVLFLRLSVLLSELLSLPLALGLFNRHPRTSSGRSPLPLLLFHPALLYVDHIHFQYNAPLLALLLLTIDQVRRAPARPLVLAAAFTTLLLAKHINLYLAPPVGIYLLRAYLFPSSSKRAHGSGPLTRYGPTAVQEAALKHVIGRLAWLALAVLPVVALTFAPFVVLDGPQQLLFIFRRLFPFQRGLNNAFWAPNLWALLTALDRVLLKVGGTSLARTAGSIANNSRGLVGDTHFAILPNITPFHTFILTLLVQAPFLVKLWINPDYIHFLIGITASAFASFLCGWHVHEKAILLVLFPLTVLSTEIPALSSITLLCNICGIASMSTLLHGINEAIPKWAYGIIWCLIAGRILATPNKDWMIKAAHQAFYCTLFIICIFNDIVHPLLRQKEILSDSTSFLPLLLISISCAVGILYSFLSFSVISLKYSAPAASLHLKSN